MRAAGLIARGVRAAGLIALVATVVMTVPTVGSAAAAPRRGAPRLPRAAAMFRVGAARVDITPPSLTGVYLGGYGIGPVHPAQAVLRHIYVRVLAVSGRGGRQAVIGAIDAQGYSIAYQQGPYGIADIEADVSRRLGIPASDIILQSTHSHNGPDDIGVWGGVPDSYLQQVKAAAETAIVRAVTSERPAALRWATADMTGFARTFGSDTDATRTGDTSDYPVDNQLRVLQAVAPGGRVTATLVNYAAHPTVYGPLDKISPDWPGATATYLEHDEIGIPARARYGYPGSTAVVTVGALGHTWPAAAPPRETDPRLDPGPQTDNAAADTYGNAVARMAMAAVGRPRYLRSADIGGAAGTVSVLNDNPVLLVAGAEPANATALGGYKIMRADTPPWAYGDVYVAPVAALRIGDLPFFSVPGEPYPSIHSTLAGAVHAPAAFVFGLAGDQLGYVEEPADAPGAAQCSLGDEWFFTISPVFGTSVVARQEANARALGFTVDPSGAVPGGLGPVPPATNCTVQQLAAPPSLP